ncbi:MAG: glycosyltransferase family 2 protein [Bacteroidetes bacterium]|nr:glycosyltransferase family 2 protein [Bacteroidota bacterium]
MPDFSFIILSFNEEVHLPRLLNSIKDLNAPVFIVDSGSTDKTVSIAESYGAKVVYHAFENHPKQWDWALKNCQVDTTWIIGLDSDHIVSNELFVKLNSFSPAEIPSEITGIYFNRKNYFKGKWIKHGGYFPKYLLKMFKKNEGKSDISENMDHRFIVTGKTMIWSDGYLHEENLKENEIAFWIAKHNRYSDLVALEELERRNNLRQQSISPKFWGNPDERIAWLKKRWWDMPLFLRPFLYFNYRFFFQLGILDGKEGWIFHFLQGFWFRMVVDIKIAEIEGRFKTEADKK